ncbi:hypothetical protein BDZ91DRAFT_715657 [Kalaharituber pfeilii]|nr:hypothetical protein BDZ91DRAFT_715657 [Kalaharituber pfeilii]
MTLCVSFRMPFSFLLVYLRTIGDVFVHLSTINSVKIREQSCRKDQIDGAGESQSEVAYERYTGKCVLGAIVVDRFILHLIVLMKIVTVGD